MKRKIILWILIIAAAAAALYVFYPRSMRSLSHSLVSKNDIERNMAYSEISKLAQTKRDGLIEELLQLTADPDWEKRRYALYALRKMSTRDPKVFSALVPLLVDANEKISEEAMISLTQMGPDILPDLVKEIRKTPAEELSDRLFLVLAHAGIPAVPHLVPLLQDTNPLLRLDAALTLNKIDPLRTDTLPIYIETLKRRPVDVNTLAAAKVVREFGSKAKEAEPALKALLPLADDDVQDKNALRPLLADTLNKLDPRPNGMVGTLWDLKHKDPVLRYRAAYKLSEMTPPNIGALPDLLKVMDDKDMFVRARAVVAAIRIGFDKSERLKPQLTKKAGESLNVVQDEHVKGYSELVRGALNIAPPKTDEEAATLKEVPAPNAP